MALILRQLLVAALFFQFSAPLFAQDHRDEGSTAQVEHATALSQRWSDISSGQHSFRQLGNDFFVDLPMRPIEHARLGYFNYELAHELGLDVPKDPVELEKLMKKLFALEIDPTGKSPLKMMATRYLDSFEKKPGEALGDGRAVWTGELRLRGADGKIQYIDFVLKGVGQTPLAWTNNPSHSDGHQSVPEATHSFVTSETNRANQLDSTADLLSFVIEEPGQPPRTLTLRVGNQTRMAHLNYWHDEPSKFEKIMNYVIRRDLGLPLNEKVLSIDVEKYMDKVTRNMAEEAARYLDLNAIHGSPTAGNRTTQGSTIDLAEFWYHDSQHNNVEYLYKQMRVSEQRDVMKSYVSRLVAYMEIGKYPLSPGISAAKKYRALFDKVYEEKAVELLLNRLGLSADEIAKLPKRVRKKFFAAILQLYSAHGSQVKKVAGQDVLPAAFDVRKILKSSMQVMALPPDRREAAWAEAFRVERSWASTVPSQYAPARGEYKDAVRQIVHLLGTNDRSKPEWIARAQEVGKVTRYEPDQSYYKTHLEPLNQALESGHFNFNDLSRRAHEASQVYVDPNLPTRASTNLGPATGLASNEGVEIAPLRSEPCPSMLQRFFSAVARSL